MLFMGVDSRVPDRIVCCISGIKSGIIFSTLFSNMMTNINLTDMEVCYKAFRREVVDTIEIEENRFGFEPEITAKVAKGQWRIYEVPISYFGRTYEEGKKIGWRDGVRAIVCILKYNLVPKTASGFSGRKKE